MTWKKVCAVGDVAENAVAEYDLDGTKIAVVRAGEDVFAYPLRCPHMEEPLSSGFCDGATVTCSFHLWEWDMRTGESTSPTSSLPPKMALSACSRSRRAIRARATCP